MDRPADLWIDIQAKPKGHQQKASRMRRNVQKPSL
jgi:hypothetical protein